MWTENKNYPKTKTNSTRQVKIDKWGLEAALGTQGQKAFRVVFEDSLWVG